jgi:hypothetical protein
MEEGVRFPPDKRTGVVLVAAEISTGLVFRSVLKGGGSRTPRSPPKPSPSLSRHTRAGAGLAARGFSGHSLRAGFCTSAAEHGASIFKMMDASRHKSVDTLRDHVRNTERFMNRSVDIPNTVASDSQNA